MKFCSICGKKAMRYVGSKGFCFSHDAEAFAAAKIQGVKSNMPKDAV